MQAGLANCIAGLGGVKIINKIHVYKHVDEDMERFEQGLSNLELPEAEVIVHEEAQRDFIVYQNLIAASKDCTSIVLVQSLDSICNGKEYIPEELRRIISSPIILMVLDYPVMLTKLDIETNHLLLQLLLETCIKPKAKLVELRAEKSKRLGRRKIRYPENWPELYEKWEAGEITGQEFMKQTGLKRGTFYHMAAEYKEYLQSVNKRDEA